jgi:hypothetical protein
MRQLAPHLQGGRALSVKETQGWISEVRGVVGRSANVNKRGLAQVRQRLRTKTSTCVVRRSL